MPPELIALFNGSRLVWIIGFLTLLFLWKIASLFLDMIIKNWIYNRNGKDRRKVMYELAEKGDRTNELLQQQIEISRRIEIAQVEFGGKLDTLIQVSTRT